MFLWLINHPPTQRKKTPPRNKGLIRTYIFSGKPDGESFDEMLCPNLPNFCQPCLKRNKNDSLHPGKLAAGTQSHGSWRFGSHDLGWPIFGGCGYVKLQESNSMCIGNSWWNPCSVNILSKNKSKNPSVISKSQFDKPHVPFFLHGAVANWVNTCYNSLKYP